MSVPFVFALSSCSPSSTNNLPSSNLLPTDTENVEELGSAHHSSKACNFIMDESGQAYSFPSGNELFNLELGEDPRNFSWSVDSGCRYLLAKKLVTKKVNHQPETNTVIQLFDLTSGHKLREYVFSKEMFGALPLRKLDDLFLSSSLMALPFPRINPLNKKLIYDIRLLDIHSGEQKSIGFIDEPDDYRVLGNKIVFLDSQRSSVGVYNNTSQEIDWMPFALDKFRIKHTRAGWWSNNLSPFVVKRGPGLNRALFGDDKDIYSLNLDDPSDYLQVYRWEPPNPRTLSQGLLPISIALSGNYVSVWGEVDGKFKEDHQQYIVDLSTNDVWESELTKDNPGTSLFSSNSTRVCSDQRAYRSIFVRCVDLSFGVYHTYTLYRADKNRETEEDGAIEVVDELLSYKKDFYHVRVRRIKDRRNDTSQKDALKITRVEWLALVSVDNNNVTRFNCPLAHPEYKKCFSYEKREVAEKDYYDIYSFDSTGENPNKKKLFTIEFEPSSIQSSRDGKKIIVLAKSRVFAFDESSLTLKFWKRDPKDKRFFFEVSGSASGIPNYWWWER